MNYIIRKKVFEYDSGIGTSANCSAGVHSIFSKLEDAERAKLELERNLFVAGFAFSKMYENDNLAKCVVDFFEKKFNLNIWQDAGKTELIYQIKLPSSCTDDELNELMKIIEESFYEIVEKEKPIIFFRPEINTDNLQKFYSKELSKELGRIFFHFNEYVKGFVLFNSTEEAFRLGLFHLIYNFQNKKIPESGLDNLVQLLENCELNEEKKEIMISPYKMTQLIDYTKELDLLTITEHELWDTMYSCLDEHEEEIKYFYNMGHFSYQNLSLEYGIPDFLIQMKLNGELDEE